MKNQIATIIFLIVLVAFIGVVGFKFGLPLVNRLRGQTVDYQIVTLANGISYFGKIKENNSEVVTLADVFILRTLPAADPSKPESGRQLQLVKPSDELYGPEDRITFNRRQILAIQGLKSDSKVLAAIREYYISRKLSPAPTPTAVSGRSEKK